MKNKVVARENKLRVIYFAFESVFDHIFDSQVLYFLKSISAKAKSKGSNIDINLLVLSSGKDFLHKNFNQKKREIKIFLNLECFFSLKIPYFFKIPSMLKLSLFLNAAITFFILSFILKVRKNDVILFHCRTEITAIILNTLKKHYFKNARIICDSRGIGSEEILYKPGLKNKHKLSVKIKEIEKTIYNEADYIFCVSHKFKEYISLYRNNKLNRIFVMPCCIDTEKFKFDSDLRFKIRDELGIKNRFAVIYSGSFNGWQLGCQTIEIFKSIKLEIKQSIFLIITRDKENARVLVENAKLDKENYLIISKPYSDINKYLLAGDLALLVRERNLLNEVAFPVKFSEYVRCGVPVLSSITSDVRDLIKNHDLGFILEDYLDKKTIEDMVRIIGNSMEKITSQGYKYRISNIIGNLMSWNNYTGDVLNIYSMLLSNSQ